MVQRRDFLEKTMAAGTGAFAVPMIITVEAAVAQALTSPPPEPPADPGRPASTSRGRPRDQLEVDR
jgi:hypothetical protein